VHRALGHSSSASGATRRPPAPACSNDDELRGLPKRASARVTGAYLSEILPPAPKPGTPEWFEHEMKEMEEAAVERHLALEAERREADEWAARARAPA